MKDSLIVPKSRLRVTSETIDKRVGEETLLINLSTNQIYSLNATATRFWQLLTEVKEQDEIFQIMLEEFEVSEEILFKEICSLIEGLKEKGFITAT